MLWRRIEEKSLHGAVFALSGLFESLEEVGTPFHDFIKFSGIFHDSKWLTHNRLFKKEGGYSSIFLARPFPGDITPHGWKILAHDVSEFRQHLCSCYDALGRPLKGSIGLEKFQSTFEDFIYGLNIDRETFVTLLSGLEDAGRMFNKSADTTKQYNVAKKAEDQIKIYDKNTPFCTINQHCKVLSLKNHSLFSNSNAWKELKDKSPSKKRGRWILFALDSEKLFELYTNYCIRSNLKSPGTIEGMFELYTQGPNTGDD